MRRPILMLDDEGRAWYRTVLREHYDEALAAAERMLDEAAIDPNNCYVTDTVGPKKVRFLGRQERAYRFVYCVFNFVALTKTEVVRHRCDNRRCINPGHMILGDRAENRADDRVFRANGVDPRYL